MYEQSHRDYLRSGYLHHRLLSWAVNHYRDNAKAYKAQRDKKCQRTEAGERGNYWHADASAWCCCALDAKYTKELADAKAENDALRDDVAAGRRRLRIKAVDPVREATTASGVDNATLPDWRTRMNGIISPAERGWSLCKKQLEGTQVY